MRRIALIVTLLSLPARPIAEPAHPAVQDILTSHILPRIEALAEQTQALAKVAATECAPESQALRRAFGTAFDAWISTSHLRFGPSETDDRAFALAFWPDSRGATPRALAGLIAAQDPIATSPTQYREVSIAARGFYALEILLYDDRLMGAGDAAYHCTLVQTISRDIATTATAIRDDWQASYADTMRNPGPEAVYHSPEEALQELFKALTAGLEFTSDSRLGRPLGSYDRPRPNRAEARRSQRSARHVSLSLSALKDLALRLAAPEPDLAADLDNRFAAALAQVAALNDPAFAGVADPLSRIRIESLQQTLIGIRDTVRTRLGPTLGVSAGFNALDGD
ncbi:imelysin family protein [Pseudooceanicola sp.]|uniref:imelysin family protein n=1 Tax=Pseudooceanicola sp. TaxID=1914328 RepID=UPI00261B0776|nr:imelysin family protein [Pseudooceanicola sp.]MDF1855292.1 imelysin family protein [Pseudooceanicola sp.]